MSDWSSVKKILCVRADNMGDVLMSYPAMETLKRSTGAELTLLTSKAGAAVAAFLPVISDTIIFDVPWVATPEGNSTDVMQLVDDLRSRAFDAAIVFTVYSQSPLPAAVILHLAGIPLRTAYCRENPYQLLTHWYPEYEPYQFIRHQAERDIELVRFVLPDVNQAKVPAGFSIPFRDPVPTIELFTELQQQGFDPSEKWIVVHAGVSEQKRQVPSAIWKQIIQLTCDEGYQVILTGSSMEKSSTNEIMPDSGGKVFNAAGMMDIKQLISLLRLTPLLVTVNTGPAHIAAATGTRILVLYALTNPQHLPYDATGAAMFYDVPADLQSRNPIISFVHRKMSAISHPPLTAGAVVAEVKKILKEDYAVRMPLLVPMGDGDPSGVEHPVKTSRH